MAIRTLMQNGMKIVTAPVDLRLGSSVSEAPYDFPAVSATARAPTPKNCSALPMPVASRRCWRFS